MEKVWLGRIAFPRLSVFNAFSHQRKTLLSLPSTFKVEMKVVVVALQLQWAFDVSDFS